MSRCYKKLDHCMPRVSTVRCQQREELIRNSLQEALDSISRSPGFIIFNAGLEYTNCFRIPKVTSESWSNS
jgi:hypothetical protein